MSMLYVVGSGGEAGGEGRKEAVRKVKPSDLNTITYGRWPPRDTH